MACASCWGNPEGCGARVQKVAETVGATYQFMDCNIYYIPALTGAAGHPNVLGHAKMANDTAPVMNHKRHIAEVEFLKKCNERTHLEFVG